jgi:hypothetical protein
MLEKIKYASLMQTPPYDFTIQLDGGGACVRIAPGQSVHEAAHILRTLAELLERGAAERATQPPPPATHPR